MSIATKRGDGGQTSLVGGTIDELIPQRGFARSVCHDVEIRERVKALQRDLYKVGSAIATPPESKNAAPEIAAEIVDALDAEVHRIEADPGVLADWSLPGELPDAAAIDVRRTISRRAGRLATALMEAGALDNPHILAYPNRLSDLFGRSIEERQGALSTVRTADTSGPRWSRPW